MDTDARSFETSKPDDPAPLVVAAPPLRGAKERPEIFISYAWGEDKTEDGRKRDLVVDGLEQKLHDWGYSPVRDKRVLRNGDTVSDFMRQIANGDRILVIFSGKYLESEACMTELNGIYENSLRDSQRFMQRIIPVVLSCAKFGSPTDRLAHAKRWRQSKEFLQANFDDLGDADRNRMLMQARWCQQIGDILAYVHDELHPHGFKQITANDYEAVRELLERKVKGED